MADYSPGGDEGPPGDDRPSFTDFWRRAKDRQPGRSITFVPSNPQATEADPPETNPASGGRDDESSSNTAQEKAQARRAQVRRAQIQHRQRKANYTKELEMDIARLRDLIEQTETETESLRLENDAIRQRLAAKLDPSCPASTTSAPQSSVPVPEPSPPHPPPQPAMKAPRSDSSAPEYTVAMSISDAMGTPALQVVRSASSSSGSRSVGISRDNSSSTSARNPRSHSSPSDLVGGLTPQETDLVINFILSLEHICWDHFDHSYFSHNSYDPAGSEHGHALMASSIAMQQAPPQIFNRIGAVQSALHTDPTSAPATADITWRTTGLTLDSLFGLAQMLNPAELELAPVQAWFEIVKQYGPDVALDAALLESIKRECSGVVKCLHFGAVIERDAFDSVVGRVVGVHKWESSSAMDVGDQVSAVEAVA